MPAPPTSTDRANCAPFEALNLRPGDRALLEVEIVDWPCSDDTNIAVQGRRNVQRFWVPTGKLRPLPPAGS